MRSNRVAVIGAGVGGLVAALELAGHGFDVTVVERANAPGGKLREVGVAGLRVDCGPTVFTMRSVFDEIFAAAGTSLSEHLTLRPVETLARHAWSVRERLDLFVDREHSADAIAAFAGPAEAARYRDFCARAQRVYTTLEQPFIRSCVTTPLGLARGVGIGGLPDLWRIHPFTSLWRALGDHFRDPRLRQLFGRYATYCGSSPFQAPATLMLIAHVEQDGVWLVEGGMHRIASALAALVTQRGGHIRYGAEVSEILVERGRAVGVRLAPGEELRADRIVFNADAAALGGGRFGRAASRAVPPMPAAQRSLSAVTWAMVALADGFPLLRHNVFFSHAYAAEFADLFRHGRLPAAPTVYVCAQDRDDRGSCPPQGNERLLCLINAPATGDVRRLRTEELRQCAEATFGLLERCGLRLTRTSANTTLTTPTDFDQLFPGTGGALYGRASHGWRASFQRPRARSRIPGLYLAGGSIHPGPGLPMAALSGRMAAAALMADRASTDRSHPVAMRGGMSTP